MAMATARMVVIVAVARLSLMAKSVSGDKIENRWFSNRYKSTKRQ